MYNKGLLRSLLVHNYFTGCFECLCVVRFDPVSRCFDPLNVLTVFFSDVSACFYQAVQPIKIPHDSV